MAISLDVLNMKGEKVGTVDLPEEVFGVKARGPLIHEVINAHLAGLRRGTHSTKTRAEVSGGGAKPWKQKHTGRARSGSTRSPLWRHGGIVFGPKPRRYTQALPIAKKRQVFKAVLSEGVREGKVGVMDAVSVAEPKTRHVAAMARKLGWGENSLLVVDRFDPVFMRAARNMAGLGIVCAKDLNSYDALASKKIVFTRAGLDQLIQRLSNGEGKAA